MLVWNVLESLPESIQRKSTRFNKKVKKLREENVVTRLILKKGGGETCNEYVDAGMNNAKEKGAIFLFHTLFWFFNSIPGISSNRNSISIN